jgi:hypothetical protein
VVLVRRVLPALAIAVAGVLALAVAVAFVKVASGWLAATDGISDPAQKAEEIGRARTAVLAILAGSVAVIGAYYTHRSFGLSRQGQITERFTRAVDQLGNRESMDVRLGGIYALERLARESRDDHGPIVEILTAFVRGWAPAVSAEDEQELIDTAPETFPEPPKPDVQAALTVLGRRRTEYDSERPWRLNLAGVYLPRADLRDARLGGANLSSATLTRARLERADLESANLSHARMDEASLDGAVVFLAQCTDALLNGASLQDADLRHTRLERSLLRRANFTDARLQRAQLADADLEGADFWDADLQGAVLRRARLRGADFTGTNLTDAELRDADLGGAKADAETQWPRGFDRQRLETGERPTPADP